MAMIPYPNNRRQMMKSLVATAGPVGYYAYDKFYADARRVAKQAQWAKKQYDKWSKEAGPSPRTNDSPSVPMKGKRQYGAKKQRKRYSKNKKVNDKLNKLSTALVELRKSEDASLGKMTWRQENSTSIASATYNYQATDIQQANDISTIESIIANLKYFNPSAPATLITADNASGTFQRNVWLKSLTTKLTMRNNFKTDCHVKVYLCKVKDDTSLNALTAWTNGLADGGNVLGVSARNNYPTDYSLFNDLYATKVLVNQYLSAGQSIECSHTEKDINYDPAVVDSHADLYQKTYKNYQFLILVNGTVMHDSANLAEIGFGKCGVDLVKKITAVVKYDAGINLSYVHVINSVNGFTTTGFGVQSLKPTSNNIAYNAY